MRHTASYNLGTISSNTSTKMVLSKDFRNAVFTVITAGFTWTIKFYSSNSDPDTRPDLTSAVSATNKYSTCQVVYLEDGSSIAWATWVAFTTNTSQRQYEINENVNNWLWVTVSWVSAGSVTILVNMADNQ